MRASPSLSQLWQPHSRLCQLCRACEQQRSCSPGFCRKEMHATEGAVEVRRVRRRLRDTVTDERVGVFTADGAFFAWGEGGHGYLGHGEDLSNQLLPEKIETW